MWTLSEDLLQLLPNGFLCKEEMEGFAVSVKLDVTENLIAGSK